MIGQGGKRRGLTPEFYRAKLIERLAAKGIHDERVLEAMGRVPRHEFVDAAWDLRKSYEDTALPIGRGQTISQPFVVALMTQALLEGREARHVLEVGTGCGYQTAVLAELVDRVYSVERIRALNQSAERRLREATCLLVDIGAYFHPDQRALHAFDTALRAPFMGISHRERVIAARHRAMDAYHRSNAAVRRNWQKGSTAAGSFVDDHPLVAGALAMAVGAAIAGALPRTRYEDEAIGSYRDELFDEAEQVFREERRKAEETAGAAIDEAGKVAQEKIRSVKTAAGGDKPVVEGVKDEAKTAGKRVADAAASEADKQELGKATS